MLIANGSGKLLRADGGKKKSRCVFKETFVHEIARESSNFSRQPFYFEVPAFLG